MKSLITIGLAAALLAVPQGALADMRSAAFATATDPVPQQSQMFAGATLRLGIGAKSAAPQAALRVTWAVARQGQILRVGEGIALSIARDRARPALTLGGIDGKAIAERAHMSGTTKALLIGSVVLVGAAVAVAIAAHETEFDILGED